MDGARGAAVTQIMKAIEYGTLPTDEMQRRLIELIQREANRTDGSADEELISACLNLMEHLQKREHVEDAGRYATLNQRIADAIQQKQQLQNRRQTVFRAIGAIAAVLVLIIGIGGPLRWTWFKSWSTPDEQQHVIMGHEISVDVVAKAIAENEANEPIVVSDFSEFEKHLGFDPKIPAVLCGEWTESYGSIRYFSGYIQIVAKYTHTRKPEKSIACTITYFTDIEFAYLSFEQNCEGEQKNIHGVDVYLSNNIDRNSATWYNHNMYARVVGHLSSDEVSDILLELIGVRYD